jgi:predicted HD phosphohydrolase
MSYRVIPSNKLLQAARSDGDMIDEILAKKMHDLGEYYSQELGADRFSVEWTPEMDS